MADAEAAQFRAEQLRFLIESLGRHRPHELSVRQTVSAIRALIKHAYVMDDGCVVWSGSRNNDNYGRFNVAVEVGARRQVYCHRVAYALAHDPRPVPLYREIGHKCDVAPCFRPEHLECVRRPENRRKSAERTNRKLAWKRATEALARSMGVRA